MPRFSQITHFCYTDICEMNVTTRDSQEIHEEVFLLVTFCALQCFQDGTFTGKEVEA